MVDTSALVGRLTRAGETIACAESLTAGLVAAAIADTPGASVVLRGGIIAYAADLKVALLGVPESVIEAHGTVHAEVAAAMAEGVRARLGATWGLATTGVAGPGPSEGHPAGTVHIAVSGPAGTATRLLRLKGTRPQIRVGTVEAVIDLALELTGAAPSTSPSTSPSTRSTTPSKDQTPAPATEARGTVEPRTARPRPPEGGRP